MTLLCQTHHDTAVRARPCASLPSITSRFLRDHALSVLPSPSATRIRRRAMSTPRRPLTCIAIIALLAALGTPVASAQQRTDISGIVVRSGTLTPVEGAQIQIEGTQLGTITDATGRFRIPNVPGERARLQIRRIGFTP